MKKNDFKKIINKEVSCGIIALKDNEICKYKDICPFTYINTKFKCAGIEKRNLNTYFICRIKQLIKEYTKNE